MAFKITVQDGVMWVALTGRVTSDDLRSLADEAKKHEQGEAVPHRITDLTGISHMDFPHGEVFALAQKRRALTFPNRFKSAIIASQPLQVGYARMFQTLNDNPHIDIRVFSDEHSASQWIKEPLEQRDISEF